MIEGSSFTAVVSTVAAVLALLALALVVRRQGTQAPPSRIAELEDEVAKLRQKVDNLTIVNETTIQMFGDVSRKWERLLSDFSVVTQENKLLHARLSSMGIDRQ